MKLHRRPAVVLTAVVGALAIGMTPPSAVAATHIVALPFGNPLGGQ